MRKITKAIFPVGGLGTRFLPATKSMPKEMLPIANKPIIQYAFEEARKAGIEQFIFVTGRNKNSIINHFDHSYELESKLDEGQKLSELEQVMGWLPAAGQIAFIRQKQALGLGHAVWCARNFIGDEAFMVILADEMLMENKNENKNKNENYNFLKSMIDFYQTKESKSSVIAVAEIAPKDSSKYGIIAYENNSKKIIDMIEKPNPKDAPSNLAMIGRYILQPEIFGYLENCPKGSGGEIQLTDAMKMMNRFPLSRGSELSRSKAERNDGGANFPFYYQKYNGKRFDCGNVLGYLEANIAYNLMDEKIKNEVSEMLRKFIK